MGIEEFQVTQVTTAVEDKMAYPLDLSRSRYYLPKTLYGIHKLIRFWDYLLQQQRLRHQNHPDLGRERPRRWERVHEKSRAERGSQIFVWYAVFLLLYNHRFLILIRNFGAQVFILWI